MSKTFLKINNIDIYKKIEKIELSLSEMHELLSTHISECRTDRTNIWTSFKVLMGGFVTLAIAGVVAFFTKFSK